MEENYKINSKEELRTGFEEITGFWPDPIDEYLVSYYMNLFGLDMFEAIEFLESSEQLLH